jgi:hypothetical protein
MPVQIAQIYGDAVMLPGITTMAARPCDSDVRCLNQVKFSVKFDHGELYKMNTRDVRVANELRGVERYPWS